MIRLLLKAGRETKLRTTPSDESKCGSTHYTPVYSWKQKVTVRRND